MGLSFLNAGFLGGLSLVSIPIIIHLLQRRRFKVVKWGAMEFLKLSDRKRSRRLMIEQLILLLIRCLVIACVVLAVCRPLMRVGGLPLAASRAPVHAVIILDNSYSMGYRPSGAGTETVWDRALKRTLDLLELGLRQGDGVSVILASDPPQVLVRRPSLDLGAVSLLVRRSATLSDSGTNFGKAARAALEVLGESNFVNREVFLISDNQARGWEGAGQDSPAWEALGKAARVVMLPVREGLAPNVAVEWVQPARGLVTARSSARIQAHIVNRGTSPVRGLLATLEIDGKPQGSSQKVDIEPGQGALVQFNQIFDRAGVRTCTVRLAPDRLPADDAGYLAMRVRQSVRVLVLNGSPNESSPQRDGGLFIRLALAPPLSIPGGEPTAIEPREITGTTFAGNDIRGYDVVVLSDPAALGEADRRLLSEFIQNGGGALVFLGSHANAALLNRDLYAASPSLLPAQLGDVKAEKTSLDAGSIDHPALQRFRGAQDVEVGTAEFQKYYALSLKEGDRSVRVMARFANGLPAMVEKQFGLGRLILVPSSANTEWNTLPLKPVFLPMVHQLVGYLATGGDGTRNGAVGQPLVKPLPLAEASKRVTITDPAGAATVLRPLVDERGATVTLDRASRAGFYRLKVEDGTEDVFAVNRDVAESDLRSLDEPALKKALPVANWSWIGLNDDLATALRESRQGIELWRHLLFAALALLVLETMLAQVFGRRA